MAQRLGLNCTLAYRTYQDKLNVYQCRVGEYYYDFDMIAEEGANARVARAYYPHRVTIGQFAITVLLKGYDEWNSFNVWMTTYARNLTDATMMSEGPSPVMQVSLAGRPFSRTGIPVQGYGFGDHLGAIYWNPQIIFDSATDPYDRIPTATPSYYKDTSAVLADKINAPYFYPFSQFSNGATDSGLYDQVQEVSQADLNSASSLAVSQAIDGSNGSSATSSPTNSSTPGDALNTQVAPTFGSSASDSASTNWGDD